MPLIGYRYPTTPEENSLKPANAFGQALRHFRASLKISQERLSQESGLDRSYISLLERGQRQPTLKSISSLANALETTLTEVARQIECKLNENR